MEPGRQSRVARRVATVVTITGMVIGLFALPAGADQFTSTNQAPTVTIFADLPATLDPTQATTAVEIRIHDDNSLEGSNLVVCVREDTLDGSDCTNAVAADLSYEKARWTLAETGASDNATTATADANNGTWSMSAVTQEDVGGIGGLYSSTDMKLTFTITVGHVARAANDWRLEVIETDEIGSSASATSASAKTVTSYYALTTPLARDFGNIDPADTSATKDETVAGIKANTTWNIKLAAAATWTTGANTIDLVTAAPGFNEFAMRCQAEKTTNDQLAAVNASNYIANAATNVRDVANAVVDYDPIGGDNGVAALRADAAGGRSRGMRCVIDNGYTRPGTYTGAVTATIG